MIAGAPDDGVPLLAGSFEGKITSGSLAPLRAKAEAVGSGDLTNLWSGHSARLSPRQPSGQLTEKLAADALAHFSRLAASTQ